MKLNDDQINEIAEDLECGMKVYVNISTGEISTIIDWNMNPDFNVELWKDVIDEIENNPDNYVEFEKMSDNESFAVMEEFVETVEDEDMHKKLELGLSLSKPFKNFKDIINTSGEYRNKWFEFRRASNIDWVRTQLQHYNHSKK